MLLALLLLAAGARAQQGVYFYPALDTYIGLTDKVSLYLIAQGSVNPDAPNNNFQLSPNIDFALLPFLEPHLKVLNPEKAKYLTFRAGYRYVKIVGSNPSTQNNANLELTARLPLPWEFQIADRNRIDLRGLPTGFTWRYRNRLTLSHSLQVHSFIATPYAEAEIFYDCKTGMWTQYNYTFGSIFRVNSRTEIESYYRRRTTIVEPIREFNGVGLRLILFFRNPAV